MMSQAFELLFSCVGVALLYCITLLSFYQTIDNCNSVLFFKEPKISCKENIFEWL
jgi:hypothetical protein